MKSVQSSGRRWRVLFVTPVLRFPPVGGPELRIDSSIKALSLVSDLFIYGRNLREAYGGLAAEEYFAQYARQFKAASFQFDDSFLTRGFKRTFNALSSRAVGRRVFQYQGPKEESFEAILKYADAVQADVIWLGYGNVSYPVLRYLKETQHRPVVLDTDSIWSKYISRGLPYAENANKRADIERLYREKAEEERWGTALADVTTAVSDIDAEYYRRWASEPSRVRILCNAVDLENYKKKPAPPPGLKAPCLFVAGSFWRNSPMEDGTRWFIENVWPGVQSRLSNIQLYVLGRGSDTVLADVRNPAITITGEVPSVLPYLSHSAAALVPLRYESGTRFKILEAGACGIPVVSTTLGAEGLPVFHNRDLLIADEPEKFADAIVEIVSNDVKAREMGENLKKLVRKNASIEVLAAQANSILEFLGTTRV